MRSALCVVLGLLSLALALCLLFKAKPGLAGPQPAAVLDAQTPEGRACLNLRQRLQKIEAALNSGEWRVAFKHNGTGPDGTPCVDGRVTVVGGVGDDGRALLKCQDCRREWIKQIAEPQGGN